MHLQSADALRGLQVEAQQASCTIHYPLGRSTAQIVRIVAEETQLLNSREKAPFLLLVEVRLVRQTLRT